MTLACAACLVVGLAAGYAGGRARPRELLGNWAHDQLSSRLDDWATYPRQALLLTVFLATDTRRTVRAWRNEHTRKEPS